MELEQILKQSKKLGQVFQMSEGPLPEAKVTRWNKVTKPLGYVYYFYLRGRKKLGITKENVTLSWWFGHYAAQIAGLINPGGSMLCREGTYIVTTSITPNANTKYHGVGWATIFQAGAGLNGKVFTISNDNVELSDLTVDGNQANQTGGYPYGIFVYGAANTRILNCCVHDTYYEGINVACNASNGSSGFVVHGCYVYHCRQSGIVVYGSANGANTRDGAISDCVVHNCGYGGATGDNIFLCGCDYCTVTNCICDTANDCNFEIRGGGVGNHDSAGNAVSNIACLNSGTTAIYLDGNSDATHKQYNTTISNFYVYNPVNNGLGLGAYVSGCEIGNGTINNCGGDGIRFYLGILNNTFHDININKTTGMGVNMMSGCNGNTFDTLQITAAGHPNGAIYALSCTNTKVRNCTITSPTGYGILFMTNCDNTIIDGCTVTGAGNVGIHIATASHCDIVNCDVSGGAATQISYATGIHGSVCNNRIKDTASGKIGISFSATSYVLCALNRFYNTTATLREGVHLYNSVKIAIQANYFNNCAIGVNVSNSDCSVCWIKDNTFISCATTVSDTGTGTVQRNNDIG